MKETNQEFTSKNTSINTTKLPAIYSKLNLEKLKGKTIFDYGAGKPQTVNIIREFLEPYDIDYIPYDIYNLSDADNCYAFERRYEADIYVCSNVLNVIKEDDIIQDIINEFCVFVLHYKSTAYNKPFLFKIYEGDKTKKGRKTKKDCWQRNQHTKDYIDMWDWRFMYPLIYKGFITNLQGKELLK